MTTVRNEEIKDGGSLPPHVKVRMLQQMAEALEDEARGLDRRVAVFEEEEFLLTREIEERQTEINRLNFKLEAMRAERDGLLHRIETIRSEATAMREEVCDGEEAMALLAIDDAQTGQSEALSATICPSAPPHARDEQQRASVFFHKTSLSNFAR
jgi:chromosome segregation ATPase